MPPARATWAVTVARLHNSEIFGLELSNFAKIRVIFITFAGFSDHLGEDCFLIERGQRGRVDHFDAHAFRNPATAPPPSPCAPSRRSRSLVNILAFALDGRLGRQARTEIRSFGIFYPQRKCRKAKFRIASADG